MAQSCTERKVPGPRRLMLPYNGPACWHRRVVSAGITPFPRGLPPAPAVVNPESPSIHKDRGESGNPIKRRISRPLRPAKPRPDLLQYSPRHQLSSHRSHGASRRRQGPPAPPSRRGRRSPWPALGPSMDRGKIPFAAQLPMAESGCFRDLFALLPEPQRLHYTTLSLPRRRSSKQLEPIFSPSLHFVCQGF